MEKALVVHGSFSDLGDLLAVARAEAKRIFCSRAEVNVKEVYHRPSGAGFVVVVEQPDGRSQPPGGKEGKTEN